jgi:hypothetical protein
VVRRHNHIFLPPSHDVRCFAKPAAMDNDDEMMIELLMQDKAGDVADQEHR